MYYFHNDEWEHEWALYTELLSISRGYADESQECEPEPGSEVPGDIRDLQKCVAPTVREQHIQEAKTDPNMRAASTITSFLDEEKAGVFHEGEILQLSPVLMASPQDRTLFVYVLQVEEERVRVASFSPLKNPASDQELITGLPENGLQVISVWNVRWLDIGKLMHSWKIGEATPQLLGDIRALWNSHSQFQSLSDDLKSRIGKEVDNPLDPRWDYFASEGALLESVCGS